MGSPTSNEIPRPVRLCITCSLDGYIAGPNGEIDWIFDPADFDLKPFLASVDTLLMGRKTYQLSVELAASMGHDPTMGMRAFVFTRSAPPRDERFEFVNEDVRSFVEARRREAGKGLWLMGGGALNAAFFDADLVDEMLIAVHPIVLGDGIPLWPAKLPRRDYELVEARPCEDGLVALSYRRPAADAST